MDLSEQTDMNPNQSFRAENQPQFQPQYPYPQGTSAFTMDQEMNMGADNFAASVQAHASASLDNGAAEPGSGQSASSLNASVPAMAASGMAPPQNAGIPYSPGGPRPSIDDSQDGGLSGGDPKRKRSKVSRACDECRRKKVRCDAAADDGTIKTCSNCARAGLTCDYSRVPMKRGPSKGYIKELSERVQQVESLQMALSNTPGYRQSLDATSGVYAEQPYSPDDPMSARRNFSFSAEQRSPFVGPEYHRDRMPSVGGWNSGSPRSAVFRARDRGSIALAPDQQPSNPGSFSKPFWAQGTEGPPPAKRQKMDANEIAKPELGQEFFNDYYRNFHTYLPILPDAEATTAIVKKANAKVQHAFVAAVQRLPSLKTRAQHTVPDRDKPVELTTSIFKSLRGLQEFMWDAARESPESRSAEDNLLYLWTYLLMAIEAENDLTRLHDGPLPRTVLIKQAVDLGWSCVTAAAASSQEHGPDHVSRTDTTPSYVGEFARAWHCATIPARLHALAAGSSNPIPRYYDQHILKKVPSIFDSLPIPGIIVCLTAGQLTVASRVVQDNLPPNQWGRNMDMMHRMTIQEAFDQTISTRAYSEGNEAILEHLRFFLDLVLSRYTLNFHPLDIVIPAAALAEALRKQITATDSHFVYTPFNLHFFTLTTITLLEFMSEGQDTELYRIANTGVEDIKAALEQLSEQNHIADEQQHHDDITAEPESARKPIHWTDALLRMIDTRLKNVAATNANGMNNSGTLPIRTLGDGSAATIDFSMLLRHGYLSVLAQQVN